MYRFVSQVDDHTAIHNYELVTIVGEHPVQPPADWKMPPLYDVVTSNGDSFVAFEDELEKM